MFHVSLAFVSVASVISASSLYSEKDEPSFYEEVFYSDSPGDGNMAAFESHAKRQTGEDKASNDGGWSFEPFWKYDNEDFDSPHECIIAKVCDFPGSGTDSGVTMEIYTNQGPNSTRLCGTNPLDYSYVNDWKTARTSKYCGKFLGDCMGKPFGSNFKVVLHLSNAIAHFFHQKDELCLDWIKHIQPGLPEQHSISAGWTTETDGPDQIKTIFD